MSSSKFSLKFNGPSIIDGEIDVAELAPALLAVGDLIRASNSVLNGNKAEASVKLKATSEGSFEAFLSVDMAFLDVVKDFIVDKQAVENANALLDLILKGAGVAGLATYTSVGLINLLKSLGGRKPKFLKEEDGKVSLEVDGVVIVTDSRVVKLSENYEVRSKVEKLVSVLDNPGIEAISFDRDSDEDEPLIIEKREKEAFSLPVPDESEAIEEVVSEYNQEMHLKVVSLTFKDKNKWRFTAGDESFYANIDDAEFLNAISNNEIAFSKGDTYSCEVKIVQTSSSEGLRLDRTITKVKEIFPAGRQLRLF